MKLNHDCIRDLLLALEENLIVDDNGDTDFLFLDDIVKFDNMKLYSNADIIYTSLKLDEAGLIDISVDNADDEINELAYNYITFEGHQYLDTIRDKSVWDKTKQFVFKAGGSLPLGLVSQIATDVLKNRLGF